MTFTTRVNRIFVKCRVFRGEKVIYPPLLFLTCTRTSTQRNANLFLQAANRPPVIYTRSGRGDEGIGEGFIHSLYYISLIKS